MKAYAVRVHGDALRIALQSLDWSDPRGEDWEWLSPSWATRTGMDLDWTVTLSGFLLRGGAQPVERLFRGRREFSRLLDELRRIGAALILETT